MSVGRRSFIHVDQWYTSSFSWFSFISFKAFTQQTTPESNSFNACFCQDRYKCLGKYFGGRSYKCTVPSKFKHIQLDFLEFVQKSESGEGREEGKEKIMQLHNERLSCMQLGTTFVLSFSFGCFNEGSTLRLPIVAVETPWGKPTCYFLCAKKDKKLCQCLLVEALQSKFWFAFSTAKHAPNHPSK